MSNKSLVFAPFSELPSPLVPAGARVLKLCSNHLLVDSSHTIPHFDWDSFKATIAAHWWPDLSAVKTESTSIVIHTPSVQDLAGRISQYLYDTFSLQGTDNEHLRETIHKAFEDAPSEGSGGFLSSSTRVSQGRTREQYMVLMAANPDDADAFYAVVATVGVAVSLYEHKGLLGIGNETRYDYSADITGMELLVKKSYASSDSP